MLPEIMPESNKYIGIVNNYLHYRVTNSLRNSANFWFDKLTALLRECNINISN